MVRARVEKDAVLTAVFFDQDDGYACGLVWDDVDSRDVDAGRLQGGD